MTQLDLLGTIEATQISPGIYLVSAHGPIDARVASELKDVLIPIAAADGALVVLDLTDAHGIDDEVLDVMGRAAHLAARRGDRLALVSPSHSLLEAVHACGLDAIVTVGDVVSDVVPVD